MKGSEKLLGSLIAATLVAGVIGLLTVDTTPDMTATPPTPTPTLSGSPPASPTPSPTVAESPTPTITPTVAESPTVKPSPRSTPRERPPTAESGIGTNYLLGSMLVLIAVGGMRRLRRSAH